jgi:nitric oxide reductase NorE protein
MSRAVARGAGGIGRIPGEPGVWVLITGDLLIFSIFFLTFAVYRRGDVGAYAAAQADLGDTFGLVNTLLLLTGSLFVFRGVTCARDRGARAGAAWMLVGASTGVAFLLSKALEWSHLFLRGASLYTSEFFMFFFMFTGIHAFHVLLGTGVLLHLYSRMRGAPTRAPSLRITEAGGVFWHLVDVLWIVLFALLYLAR